MDCANCLFRLSIRSIMRVPRLLKTLSIGLFLACWIAGCAASSPPTDASGTDTSSMDAAGIDAPIDAGFDFGPICKIGQILCDGDCTDIRSHVLNCGACG